MWQDDKLFTVEGECGRFLLLLFFCEMEILHQADIRGVFSVKYCCKVILPSQVLPLHLYPHLSNLEIMVEDGGNALKWSESDSIFHYTRAHAHAHSLAGEIVLRRMKTTK